MNVLGIILSITGLIIAFRCIRSKSENGAAKAVALVGTVVCLVQLPVSVSFISKQDLLAFVGIGTLKHSAGRGRARRSGGKGENPPKRVLATPNFLPPTFFPLPYTPL
jgi:hypothetical protein